MNDKWIAVYRGDNENLKNMVIERLTFDMLRKEIEPTCQKINEPYNNFMVFPPESAIDLLEEYEKLAKEDNHA